MKIQSDLTVKNRIKGAELNQEKRNIDLDLIPGNTSFIALLSVVVIFLIPLLYLVILHTRYYALLICSFELKIPYLTYNIYLVLLLPSTTTA